MRSRDYHLGEVEAAVAATLRYLRELDAAEGRDLRAALWDAVKAASRGADYHLLAAYHHGGPLYGVNSLGSRAERCGPEADAAYFRTLAVRRGAPAEGDEPLDFEVAAVRREAQGHLAEAAKLRR
jgi:hypothetical protein